MPRDDFSSKVRDQIARRAGYMCSWPGCKKLTWSASERREGAVNIGVAAHISAAASRGPRYDESQSQEERASADNGIWLCQDHAHQLDADAQSYNVERIRKWKMNHEEQVRNGSATSQPEDIVEVSGEHVAKGKGNVTALDIQSAAIIKPGTRSVAEGEGNVTATRIGKPRKEEEK